MQCKFSTGCQTPAEIGRAMCAPHARLVRLRWAAHVARCREERRCVRCGEAIEPWRQANECTACTQAMSDMRRTKKGKGRTSTCRRCGLAGHQPNACTIPPFDWAGPISESLEQIHVPLDDEVRNQKENDLATYLAHVKRLQWELAHNRGIVIRRRDG